MEGEKLMNCRKASLMIVIILVILSIISEYFGPSEPLKR